MKGNYVKTTISKDTRLLLYYTGYHKTNDILEVNVNLQEYYQFKKTLHIISEKLCPFKIDANEYSFEIHSIESIESSNEEMSKFIDNHSRVDNYGINIKFSNNTCSIINRMRC